MIARSLAILIASYFEQLEHVNVKKSIKVLQRLCSFMSVISSSQVACEAAAVLLPV